MKTLLSSTAIVVIGILNFKCQPDRNPNGTYIASLKGEINKITENIVLGDTLKLTFQWPDLLTTKTPLGDIRTDAVNSLESAWFAYRVFRVDTVNRTVYTRDSTKIKEFLTEGKEISCNQCYGFTPYFKNDTKPYRCVLNILPQTKGLFYIEIVAQPGAFKINNNFEGLFKLDFNVSNKHANLIAPYLTSWEYVVEQRGREGFGIYCFRVI